ncbi:hypothetical protein QYS49_33250 [Marivirga salinae]|uniref:Uncharacterized protein n=1 Tax=Marivirga salinarum TaxID=3059078 RepID=A0AA51REE8_9BACT|nr:hypothetical protein [Marivirga sp. BDSF4-3]WMN12329.1 hypothetical protein QYS49_33250 [Marivirga sp. BDSF4-3]
MKFFLVISIFAFWWIPMNSPGKIGILKNTNSISLLQPKIAIPNSSKGSNGIATKRKMDHVGFQYRKHLIKKK